MHFEVYVDSLLILHFVMNAYLLALVNKMLHQTMSRRRILCGALMGAVLSLVPFVLPINLFLVYVYELCFLGAKHDVNYFSYI